MALDFVVPVLAALKALDLLRNTPANQRVSAALYFTGMENGMGMHEISIFFGVVHLYVHGGRIDDEWAPNQR